MTVEMDVCTRSDPPAVSMLETLAEPDSSFKEKSGTEMTGVCGASMANSVELAVKLWMKDGGSND